MLSLDYNIYEKNTLHGEKSAYLQIFKWELSQFPTLNLMKEKNNFILEF